MTIEHEVRKIILNGDDFGFSRGVNRGIIESIQKGILTSTSVMVNRPFAFEAKELSKFKNISVGLHLDLTEEGIRRWTKILYILTWPEKRIRTAFEQQINKFVEITGKLPAHIDSHHHIHWLTGFKNVVLEFSKQKNIPVRCVDAQFQTGFYGRSLSHWNDPNGVSAKNLISVIKNLQPGIHEIMCHPGFVDDDLKKTGTTYLDQREQEVKALRSGEVKQYVMNDKTVKLISWSQLG